MNIAMITSWNCKCGIFTYSQHLSEALAQSGNSVYIVRLPRFGVKTEEIVEQVARNIPVYKVDCIHCQHEYGLYQGFEGVFYRVLDQLGKPVVTTMHATGIHWSADATISNVSTKVIVHNKFMQRKYLFPSVVIPHGCTPYIPTVPKKEARIALGIPVEAPIVGYCGFISNYKGLENLISAMEKIPNAALFIAGGWHTDTETIYIQRLKEDSLRTLQGRCLWHGYAPDALLPTIYGAMDIVVYPALYASESGALTMAMSHGKAILASNIPPFREKNKYIMTFKNIDNLVEKIQLLLNNPELVESYEEKSRRYVSQNSWEKIALKHVDLYRDTVKTYTEESRKPDA